MTTETGKVTFMGNPLTLIGKKIGVGDMFPTGVVLANNDLTPFKIDDEKGVKIITTVPSLDTPVCDTQVRKFNEKASGMNVKVFAISADLPFAQARWCGGAGIKNVRTLSDHAHMALADALGVHIRELRLFARTVFVVDGSGNIAYVEIVPEVTNEPDYEAALAAVQKLI